MSKFEIGNRIRVVNASEGGGKYFEVGFTGTVVKVADGILFVVFDQATDYVKRTPYLKGVSWACCVEEVEIIEEVKA